MIVGRRKSKEGKSERQQDRMKRRNCRVRNNRKKGDICEKLWKRGR